jgi:hypothetical protein
MRVIVLSATVGRIEKKEIRICGAFQTKDLAQQALDKLKGLSDYWTPGVSFKMTEVELNQAADWGEA